MQVVQPSTHGHTGGFSIAAPDESFHDMDNNLEIREIEKVNNQRTFKQFVVVLCILGLSLAFFSGANHPKPARAQASGGMLWQDVPLPVTALKQRADLPRVYRSVQLNLAALDKALANAPSERQTMAGNRLELSLPLPEGGFQLFQVEEYSMMEPGLADKHPELRTYLGRGIDDPFSTIRLTDTPFGLSGMILQNDRTVFIEPAAAGDTIHYIVYDKQDAASQPWSEGEIIQDLPSAPSRPEVSPWGDKLHQYRFAVAATSDYAALFGGDLDLTRASIVGNLNFVNGILEREVSVRLVLVANNDNVIYTSPVGDPYAGLSGSALFDPNQTNLDTVIGNANYDIGSVLDQGTGGEAGGSACDSPSKGRQFSGMFSAGASTSGAFATSIWLHEISHQFTALHSFNADGPGSCTQRHASQAYEPGSGSTIMSYASVCGTQNLQNRQDDYFQAISFDAMTTHINNNLSCGTHTSNGNTPPVVNAGPNYTIPANTSFLLRGSATDANSDPLLYTWEQFDLATAAWTAYTTLPNTDTGAGPLFRSYAPTPANYRYLPALDLALTRLSASGEALPTTSRSMQFRLTARDGKGGVNNGATTITVANTAGPFAITSPTGSFTWSPNSAQTVTWNVASTDQAPVSCPNVNILLTSADGGTVLATLASGVPNNGSAAVTVPNIMALKARLQVKCANNIFLAVTQPSYVCSSLDLNETWEGGQGGWTTTQDDPLDPGWLLKTDGSATNPRSLSGGNYWWASDGANWADIYLVSPVKTAGGGNLTLDFYHWYKMAYAGATYYHGGVVEISVNSGAWTYVPAANFITNGYDHTVNSGTLLGIQAFAGISPRSGTGQAPFYRPDPYFIESRVDLSSFVNSGDTYQIRFRSGHTPNGEPAPPNNAPTLDGWVIDDVAVCSGSESVPTAVTLQGVAAHTVSSLGYLAVIPLALGVAALVLVRRKRATW